MNEMIKTHQAVIGEEVVTAVNARELHRELKSKQQFSHWIQDRIKKYGFEENKDFQIILSKSHGRPSKEYIVSLDMGKELAMVENNLQGRKIRRYFIEVEKRYRQNNAEMVAFMKTTTQAVAELAKSQAKLAEAVTVLAAGQERIIGVLENLTERLEALEQASARRPSRLRVPFPESPRRFGVQPEPMVPFDDELYDALVAAVERMGSRRALCEAAGIDSRSLSTYLRCRRQALRAETFEKLHPYLFKD